ISRLPPALAARVRAHGATPGARPARVAIVLQLPPASMEETADHQRDRTLFRGSAATDAPHGLLCEREKRRPNYLLHLPALCPGMENPHPQPIYTSCVTSPSLENRFTNYPARCNNSSPYTLRTGETVSAE